MEHGNITYLKDLDLARRDYTVKVRVLRLWKQPMYNNPEQFYSIEMIVVDEEGTTMQGNVLRRYFPRFEQVFNESDCYFIVKPTIGLNESKYKYVDNKNKLGIYCDTDVYPCKDFNGPIYGFSFTSFKDIIDKTVPENKSIDVIGFVADVKDLKKFKTARGKDTKKLNVIIQDLEMESIYLSLWDSYVDRILEHWENREQHGVIVVILQFGTLKYFGRFGYVNSCFNVSKLFINSDVDEMTTFRNSLIANSAASSCSSQSSRLSGIFLSLYDEYVVRSEFNNIAEVNLNQAKSVVVVGTVQMISEDLPWYYFACKTCNKKVFPKVNNDTPTVGVLVDEEEVYECKTKTCKDIVIEYTKRLKIPLTVQDSSGTVSLTLFDRDACRILKTTAANLIEKHVAGGDKGLYPDEFEALLGKKFAFKIDISEFNIEHNFWFFGVSKLTDDEDIIFELEKKANNIEVETTASLNNRFTDMESEDTVNLNDDNCTDVIMGVTVGTKSNEDFKSKVPSESMDDNVITPLAKNLEDTAMASKPLGEPAIFKRKTKKPAFKKNLVESYDVDENGEMSTTKPVKPGKPTLLIPKIEK
ncbi:putative nucleic acid-binding, replication factor A [Helianthus annuus]|nr:putative nucleic acid-binding, replication factor A [Helianthus annuus]